MGVGKSAMASPEVVAPKPENALPKVQPEMYTGTSAGAVLAQLRAAGVRTLFHTNTSGFVPFWEAIYKAGDVQVINMTHEGQGVAAAAGYTMASRNMGFFFGSHVGTFNALSNIYCVWKDRVPLLVTFSGGGLAEQGKDSFESWDNPLGPTQRGGDCFSGGDLRAESRGECRWQTGRQRSGSGRQSHPATELPAMPRFGGGNDKIGFGGLECRHRKNDDLWSQNYSRRPAKTHRIPQRNGQVTRRAFPVLLANVLAEM